MGKFQDEGYAPMHTCEHIVNRTMVNLYDCGRAVSAHIEKKKSKLDFALPHRPSDDEVAHIEEVVNGVIARRLPVHVEMITVGEAAGRFDLSRLPADAPDTLRVVRVGDYDECLCSGAHVSNTAEIGRFVIVTHDYDDQAHRWRMRYKLVAPEQ